MTYGLTSTMNGNRHWFTKNLGDYGWYAGCCDHRNRFFVCAKPAGPAETSDPIGNTNEGWCKFISAYECNDEFVRNNCSAVCDLLLAQEATTTATETECAWIDNQYWSYGDYQTVNDVSDYITCCRLCKDDPKCTNFSYGKEGHGYAKQCMKKRGGSAQGRSEFISSPRDMTSCSCGEE